MAALVRLVANTAELQRLVSRDGPGGRIAERIATRTQQIAKERVGYSQPQPGMRPRSRHIRDAIVKRFATVGGRFSVLVGLFSEPEATIARYHHEGTPPHAIDPRRPGGLLVFFWRKTGRVMYLRHVNHPGTKPNPFLRDALNQALREVRSSGA